MNDDSHPQTPPSTALPPPSPLQPSPEAPDVDPLTPELSDVAPSSSQAQALSPVPAMTPFQPPAAPPVIPPGGVLYKVDSSRADFAELWRDCRSPLVPLVWLTKLLRVRLPGSVNDPNVESLRPFEIAPEALPADVRDRFAPALQHLAAVGFDAARPICHAVVDLFNNSRAYIVALPRADGRAVGRIHLRTEGTKVPPRTHFYCDILTELHDGSFLWSTAAKSTLRPPPDCRVRQDVAASPAELWSGHERALAQLASAVRPATRTADVVDLIERHHAKLRDLHLRRKLFAPLTETDRQNAAALDATYGQAAAGGFAYPEVLAEMERLQNKKTSWVGGLVILVLSLLLFVWAGVGDIEPGQTTQTRSVGALALLVPILFVHELGHYLAMRLFRYRNLRMFFIPFFGAAVSGQNYSAPGWKKVIVSLMGPLPGILIGAALGVAGILMHNPLYMRIALMALILNGFNLLPVLPLDGGRVMQALFFSRHYALDVAFRVIAALALLALSLLGGGGRFLLFLGVTMLLGIPLALRTARLATALRREGFAPPPSESQTIPPDVAQVIIARIKAGFPKAVTASNKNVAQHALSVYETLCTRPPGWGATIGFTFLHGGAFVVAVTVALVLTVAQHGPLGRFARAAAAQPKHAIALTDIAIARGPRAAVPSTAPVGTLFANFATPAAARDAFDAVRPRLDTGQSLERFGQTLLLTFPRADDAARRRWLADLESRTRDVAVDRGDASSPPLVLTCIAPTDAAAAQVEQDANDYLRLPHALNLIPPWSPDDTRTPDQRRQHHLARATYSRLTSAGLGAYKDPRVQAIGKQFTTASRRGDTDEAKQLLRRRAQLTEEIRLAEIKTLRDTRDGTVDPVIVETYLSLPNPASPDAKPDEFDEFDEDGGRAPHRIDYASPAYQAMARRMGQAAPPAVMATTTTPTTSPTSRPTLLTNPYATRYGSVTRVGLLLHFHYVNFTDPLEGARAMVTWLDAQHCASMKYEFKISTGPFDDE